MKRIFLLPLLWACGLLAQPTMILTPSYISTLKARAAANSAEWQVLRTACDGLLHYTAGTPDHLPQVYSSMENASDGNSSNYIQIGTDGNNYEGTATMYAGLPLCLCYLMLKDGDVTPSGWSSTWNGISLTPKQYGLLAGIQAVKVLNKTTPSMARITPASVPNNWGGLAWRPVGGVYQARMGRWAENPTETLGAVDTYTSNAITNAPTAAGNAVLYFTNAALYGSSTPVFTVGDQAVGTNIPPGTTVQSIVPNTSITLSANVTGSGVATGALIADVPANTCASAGQAPVFVGIHANPPPAHSAITLSGILGPLGTLLNGNTYYVSTNSNAYGFYLDTTVGGGTAICAVPNQGTDYKGAPVGSGQNYNHDPQAENEYSDRFFLVGMAVMYDWLHPLLNQSVATALNGLATLESTAVKNTFTAGGTAWNASTNPWTDSTTTTDGNYPQAIPTSYATLQAQALDSMDAWTRELLVGYYSSNDVGTLAQVASNYHWGHYNGYALAGIAAYNDDARGPVWYDYWRNHIHLTDTQPYTARWFGPQGNQMDAWSYLSQCVLGAVMAHASNITAMGDDLVTNSAQPFSWLLGLEYYKHNLEPGGRSMLNRGGVFKSIPAVPPCVNCTGAYVFTPVQYLADLENAPLKNQFRSFVQNFITTNGGYGAADNPFEPFLFWDPNGTQTAWTGEPTVLGNLSNPAGGYGHVFMRNDWTTGAIYGSFEARPYVFDEGNGHDPHEQSGSLLIQRASNTLLVKPPAECTRQNPATEAGAGAAMMANAQSCFDTTNGFYWGAGYYTLATTAGNPSTTTTVDSLVLTTSAPTSSGAVLTFASTTGVTTGMTAIGTNIPLSAYVLGITSTTVILNQSVTGGGVGNGASITFATVGTIGTGPGNNPFTGPQGTDQRYNYTYGTPGAVTGGNIPVCTGPGSPYVPGPTYTVAGSTVTVTPSTPLTTGWANGTPAIFTWSTGATPPTYYLSGSSGPTESVTHGVLYLIINWNSGGTFGIMKAPTNKSYIVNYPTTGTALVFATSGSGTNIIHAGTGCTAGHYPIGVVASHPARVDLLESTASYVYTRGIGLETNYNGLPGTTSGGTAGRVVANQREVLYLLPKLFLVYDRTRQTHWNQQAVTFNSLVDTDGTNPVYVVVNAGHNFHSGMQVKITGCSNTAVNNNTYTITALDLNRFALNGVTTSIGTPLTGGTATGNIWGHQIMPWHTGAKPVEVTTGPQAAAGMRQWHVKAPAVSIASIGNTTPVTLVTSTPHNLNVGFTINVAGVTGACAGLNGTWTVTIPTTGTATDLTHMTLNGSTACGTGTVGSATIQKFNGAITTIKPATPPVVLADFVLAAGGTVSGSGYTYRLTVHDPRDCTSNASWCTPTSPDTADSQNWLTALDASQSATDTAVLTPLTATHADMVQVSANVVAGFQNAQVASGDCANYTCTPPVPVLPITYSFTQGTGTVNHYVAGVTPGATYFVNASTPGTVTIFNSGNSGATLATSSGILRFATQSGVGTTVTTISGPVQMRGAGSIQ